MNAHKAARRWIQLRGTSMDGGHLLAVFPIHQTLRILEST